MVLGVGPSMTNQTKLVSFFVALYLTNLCDINRSRFLNWYPRSLSTDQFSNE